MTTRLDISIGPVQGFVAQSRRTRDLWGSSYLLSFLSAHAMHGAANADGRVIQPVVDGDQLYRWVSGDRTGDPPQVGTLPNHFVINVDGDAQLVARAAVESLDVAWKQVCDAVWKRFVSHACEEGSETEAIWYRQVCRFWEILWTAAPPEGRGGLLTRRKHWRTHRLPEEPGDKCTIMHDLQELSGYVRAGTTASREKQDRFWSCVREGLGPLDLRDHERLCAVALVKRLFPRVAPGALGWMVDTSHWPSTVYMGAVPWILRAVAVAPEEGRKYADAVRLNASDDVLAERHPAFAGLDVAAAGDFPKLDANYLHREFVNSERLCPLAESAGTGAREELDGLLKAMYDAKDRNGSLGPPPSFYALLLADGDRLGRLLGRLGDDKVSEALGAFTSGVRDVVKEHHGVTVYAGGDDVLAMLPMPTALACAQALSDTYRSAFPDAGAENEATLSAAVVMAHVRLPLNYVLGEAHRLLDEVAKDGNGRNSLAASVLKPGGPYCQWVTTWTRPGPDDQGQGRAVDLLDGLVRRLDENTDEPGLSGALIYRIRDTLTRLCGWEQWRPGNWGDLPKDLDVHAILRAEVSHSLDVRMDGDARNRGDELTEGIRYLLGPARNPSSDDANGSLSGAGNRDINQAGVDALLLARFLADPAQGESGR